MKRRAERGRAPVRLMVVLTLLVAAPWSSSQVIDLGPATEPVDELLGAVVPPTVETVYTVLGQNITQEDVRMFLDLNVTHASAGLAGLIVGSGTMEVQAKVYARLELRIISTDRIRAALEGENALNISAENATWLSELYLPADVFRLTLVAEAIALFQAYEERKITEALQDTLPELDVVKLDITWKNVLPTDALTDFDLTEPPIVMEIDAIVRYLRVESISSLLGAYMGKADGDDEAPPRVAHGKSLRLEHGVALAKRDFFAAAAYTQLLNLSMQPGWSLEVDLRVPRGFTFEYFNEAVEVSKDRQSAHFRVDATTAEDEVQVPLVASLTHRRAVALALFSAMWIVAGLVWAPFRYQYAKRRVPRLLASKETKTQEPRDSTPK